MTYFHIDSFPYLTYLFYSFKAAGNPASVRDANAAAHNAQRQQVQQNVGAQAPPIATQVNNLPIIA